MITPSHHRLPADAAPLGRALWQRSRGRVRAQFGFEIDAPDALQRARAGAAAQPDDPGAGLLLAAVLSLHGEDEAAEGEARRVVTLADTARVNTTLAAILVQRGAAEEGRRLAQKAAQLDPGDPHAQYNLGLAEEAGGDRRSARLAFRAAWRALYATASPGEKLPRPPWWRWRDRPRRPTATGTTSSKEQ